MTMRLDIVTNDAGELVRREHARDLGAGVVVQLYRLARLAQLHDLGNQAFVRQLEQTHQMISEYCLRSGTNVNILFAQKAVFVAGQLLKGSRGTYEASSELSEILEWCGGSELSIQRDVTQPELLAFAEAISAAMRGEKGRGFRSPSPRIRLRAVADAARLRGLDVERLPVEQRIVRNYANAVVVMRRFFDNLTASKYVLPRRIKRVAQNLVDLSAGSTPAFLGVTEVRNANHDAAGRAVNTAILAVAMAREVTGDRSTLAQIAMAAMMHDVGRPRAAALATAGGPRISKLAARLSEDSEDRLPNGTAAVLTALGRVNEPSITRTVIAFEALWLRRASSLGPVYRGVRPPTLHARIVTIARRYNDLLTPEPGLAPPVPDAAIAALADELVEPADRTVLRMLVAALGLVPPGTVVQLSSGEVGELPLAAIPGSIAPGPRVRIAMDAQGSVLAAPTDVDLARAGESRRIARVLSVDAWKKAHERVARPTELPSSPSRSAVVPTDPRAPIAQSPTVVPPAALNTTSQTVAPPEPLETVQPPRLVHAQPPPPEEEPSGTSPSAVAEAMGRMIEEALRGAPAPPKPGDAPISSLVRPPQGASVSPAPSPPPPPSPLPTGRPTPATQPPPHDWTVTEPNRKPVEGAQTVADMKAARALTPPPPALDAGTHVPTARGTLGATPLAHVLVYMLNHALTGSILFREPDNLEHLLYFQQGAVSKVQVARPSSRIGDELVGAGLVSRAVISEAVEGSRRLGVLLGEYLVGHDRVSRESLQKALETQIASRVASLVNNPPETTYSFYRDVDLLASLESEGVVSDPLNVILATVRAWEDRARIRATLARIAKHPLAFHSQSDPLSLALTTEERKVVECMRETKPATSALFQRHLADEEVVSSLLYALAVTRQFAFKGQKGTPMGGRGAAIPIPIAPPATSDVGSVRVPPSLRAPDFHEPDFAEDLARASALPPEPSAQSSSPVSFVSEDIRMMHDAGPLGGGIGGGGARTFPSAPWQPGTPSERPSPMNVERSSSEVANAERALEAMTHFRLAEGALQRGDVVQAERLASRAMLCNPEQTDYLVLHAWIRAMAATSDEAANEGIHTLTRVLAQEADHERALLYRGKLYKRTGRHREALRDFERLLQENPRNREAATEARLLKQRSVK